jgi:2-polyprenyl-3-methyl-5-hydroxy-6-metoxy-1,4-benzoquinol methylase
LYRSFKDPFNQSKKEKFETSKAAIINYANLLQEKRKKKLITLEIGCGFGQLTERLAKLGFKAYGTDISETAIKKAKARCREIKKYFFTSNFSNYSLYTKINPDIIIMSEITWYVLPELKSFIKFIKKKFKHKYLIHSLAIYYPGRQKYAKEYFTNNREILKFFNLKYIEYGEKWNKEEGRSFFLAKI